MVEPLRHRQTKGAETDMFDLQLPRHISILPLSTIVARRLNDLGDALGASFREAILDRDGATLDPAEFAQSPHKSSSLAAAPGPRINREPAFICEDRYVCSVRATPVR
jgi:hypothetical protein